MMSLRTTPRATQRAHDAVQTVTAEATGPHVSSRARVEASIPALRSYAWSLLRSYAEADDLVHDCLVHALDRLSTLPADTDSQVRTWLFAIMHNLYVSRQAKVKSEESPSRLKDYDPKSIPVSEPKSPEPENLSETSWYQARQLHAKAYELGFTVESAIEALEQAAKAAKRETMGRVEGQPHPHSSRSVAEAHATAQVITRGMLLGSVPTSLQTAERQKYVFADELFNDPQAVRGEQSIANKLKYKVRTNQPVTDDERARGNIAKAFLGQLRTRQRHLANG